MKKIDETKYKKFETLFEYFPQGSVEVVEFNSVDDLKNNSVSSGESTCHADTIERIEKNNPKKEIAILYHQKMVHSRR